MKNIIVAISGASGAIYALTILQILNTLSNISTHLIISKAARITIKHELKNIHVNDIISLANHYYEYNNIAACIASGSFISDGMIIVPCSVKTLSEVATSNANNLISRSADVMLKERKKLVLVLRETPLHYGHIKHMLTITKIGGIIAPPLNSFYIQPHTIQDLVDYSIVRILDLLDIHINHQNRWINLKK